MKRKLRYRKKTPFRFVRKESMFFSHRENSNILCFGLLYFLESPCADIEDETRCDNENETRCDNEFEKNDADDDFESMVREACQKKSSKKSKETRQTKTPLMSFYVFKKNSLNIKKNRMGNLQR